MLSVQVNAARVIRGNRLNYLALRRIWQPKPRGLRTVPCLGSCL